MATPTPQPDDLRYLKDLLKEINRRLETLERPTGTQTAGLLNQVQTQLASIDARVTNAIAVNSYTKAQIDSKVASPGDITPGNVTATGAGNFPTGLKSLDARNRVLSSGYAVAYWDSSGQAGIVPSTRELKNALEEFTVDLDEWISKVPLGVWAWKEDDAQSPRIGPYAEDVNEVVPAAVIHEDGKPFGLHVEMLPVIVDALVRQHVAETRAQNAALQAQVDELRSRLDGLVAGGNSADS